MVLVILSGGVGGDLGAGPGAGADTVYVKYEEPGFNYNIYSWAGADMIDLQDSNEGESCYVYSGAGNDTIIGSKGDDYVFDQSGNDLIRLRGDFSNYFAGKGNDTAIGGSSSDGINFGRLYDNTGDFTNNTTGITCDLAKKGAQNFGIFGTDRISGFEDLYGGSGADRLFGNGGRNFMNGHAGSDLLNGRGGNDILFGDEGRDRLIGGAGDDTFYGGDGSDNLTGGTGNDSIRGDDGQDTLNGDAGADSLEGGEGQDRLIGGAGVDRIFLYEFTDARDIVRYTRISDSGTGISALSIDVIEGFNAGGGATDDKIDLSAIDARPGTAGNQAFLFRGAGAFTSAAGEVRIEEVSGDSYVFVDIDGDAASEMNIRLVGATGLTAADFIL